MRPTCLASSSHGNCFILEFDVKGIPTRIMVECGVPKTTLYQRLNENGIDISSIKACLITHAHKDHSCSAFDINQAGIPLFASKETLDAIQVSGTIMESQKAIKICDGIFAMAFNVEHDCPGSMGFVIKTNQECVLFINDHKRWTCNLKNFEPDYIFIESNYDHKVVYAQLGDLKKRITTCELSQQEWNECKTKIAQHERNLNSHCSLHGTLYGLKKLNLKKTKCIFLIHLSDRYANEYRMKNEVEKHYGILTLAAQKNGGIK